jgi:hypothetical protein
MEVREVMLGNQTAPACIAVLLLLTGSLVSACSGQEGTMGRHHRGMMRDGMPMMMGPARADTAASPKPIAAAAESTVCLRRRDAGSRGPGQTDLRREG